MHIQFITKSFHLSQRDATTCGFYTIDQFRVIAFIIRNLLIYIPKPLLLDIWLLHVCWVWIKLSTWSRKTVLYIDLLILNSPIFLSWKWCLLLTSAEYIRVHFRLGKGLTSWLSFVVSSVSLSLSHWYPGSGVVLDCIDSWSLHHYLLLW